MSGLYSDGTTLWIAKDLETARVGLAGHAQCEPDDLGSVVVVTCRVAIDWGRLDHLPIMLLCNDDVEVNRTPGKGPAATMVTAPGAVWARFFPAGELNTDVLS